MVINECSKWYLIITVGERRPKILNFLSKEAAIIACSKLRISYLENEINASAVIAYNGGTD